MNRRQVRSNGVRRLGWTWAAVLILLGSMATTGFASGGLGDQPVAIDADRLLCQAGQTGYWSMFPVEILSTSCVAETAASAPKTAYQALPDRYWEYSLSELGQHVGKIVYLDETSSQLAVTVTRAPKTRYQALPDRFWEYSLSELGQHMNQIVFLDEE